MNQVAAVGNMETWGWLPALSLVSACGLLLVSWANTAARVGAAWPEVWFWSGLLVLLVPAAVRLASCRASRRERIGLIVVLGLSLYLVKVLNSPLFLTYHDELLTWRTTHDIIQTAALFKENTVHPVGPLYPGLAIVTASLASLGGVSIFEAGILVLGVARLLLILALYLFYEEASGSALISGVAVLLYMANPNFVFFDAQFAYESLALPLAALTLLATAWRQRAGGSNSVGETLVVLFGLGAVVVTHHVTSYALLAFLVLWTVTTRLERCNRKGQPGPGGIALLCLVTNLSWLTYVASLTIGYLAPYFVNGMGEIVRIIAGESAGRDLFRSFAGTLPPTWERLTGYAAVGLIMMGLPFALFATWKYHRDNATTLALATGALMYPASQVLRLTQSGFFVAVRASEFLFVAVAFVLATGTAHCWLSRRPDWKVTIVFVSYAVVVFVGGVILGRPPWMRLPGPYLVVADTRSIEMQGLAAADWARTYLGLNHRVASDRINGVLMGAYGEQQTITGIANAVPLGTLFFSPDVGPREQAILQSGRIEYLVIDYRLNDGLPMAGYYFQASEPGAYRHTVPIASAILTKFDGLSEVSRLFDSGDLVIYDVRALSGDQ